MTGAIHSAFSLSGDPSRNRRKLTDDKRATRSVLECASPLALWAERMA